MMMIVLLKKNREKCKNFQLYIELRFEFMHNIGKKVLY